MPLKRYDRPHTRLTYLNDYVCNSVLLNNLSNSCFNQPTQPPIFPFSGLSVPNQYLINSISNIVKPTIFSQANMHPALQQAMELEFKALETNQPWK